MRGDLRFERARVSGGARRGRGQRGSDSPERRKKLEARFCARGGKGGRASTRARARTEIVPSHGAQVEAEAVERKVGRVRVHHLELRRERSGGENVRRGIFTKTTEKRVGCSTDERRTQDRLGILFPRWNRKGKCLLHRSFSGNPKGREAEK